MNKNLKQHFGNEYTAITHLPTMPSLRISEVTFVLYVSPPPTYLHRVDVTTTHARYHKRLLRDKTIFSIKHSKNKHKITVEIHASTTAVTIFPGGLTLCKQKFPDKCDTLYIYTVYRTCIETN